MRSTGTMVQEGLSVVFVSLSNLDQLKDLVDGIDFNLVGSINEELLVFGFVNSQVLLNILFIDDK